MPAFIGHPWFLYFNLKLYWWDEQEIKCLSKKLLVFCYLIVNMVISTCSQRKERYKPQPTRPESPHG